MPRKKSDLRLEKHSLSLSERQGEWLERQSQRRQISTSEILRGVLDDYIDREERLIPRTRRKPIKTAERRQMSLDRLAA